MYAHALRMVTRMIDGYTNSNMVGDIDFKKSTYGYIMTFARGAMLWQSRLKKCVFIY